MEVRKSDCTKMQDWPGCLQGGALRSPWYERACRWASEVASADEDCLIGQFGGAETIRTRTSQREWHVQGHTASANVWRVLAGSAAD